MRLRLLGLAAGLVCGFTFGWARLTDPATFHQMLTLQSPDIYLLMASAVAIGAAGAFALRGRRAPLTGELILLDHSTPERRHVLGGIVFGVGWAVVASCPGPLIAQAGSGRVLSLVALAGVVTGVLARERLAASTPGRALPDVT
jgi:uncharacterized membrane protein YedE/YeeE